jgi:hypothetical protein
MVARGETPKWDNELKKMVSSSSGEATIGQAKTPSAIIDPQSEEEPNEDLPF